MFLEKISLSANIRNKCVIRKINLYYYYYYYYYFVFFDVMKYDHIISSKLWHFLYNNRFLFSREMENIRSCKEIKLQKLMKLRLSEHYLFWHFSSCLKMNNHLGRASYYYFLQNVLMET